MRKASFILVVSLIISIALTGCGSKITSNSTGNLVQPGSNNAANQNSEASQSANESLEAKNFNLVTATYVNKNVKINYPQITGFSDANKQRQINDIIKNDILNDYKKDVTNVAELYYDKNYQKAEAALTESVNYEIKLNSAKLLSVLYVKNGSIPDSMHPDNALHSLNINIENMTILKLKDIININYGFVEKIKNGIDKIWKAKALNENEFNNTLAEEISEDFSSEYDKDLINEYNEDDYSFYFTKDRFGMNHYVSHASGDYATIEIDYNNLKDNIKPDNEVWKALITTPPTNNTSVKSSLGNISDITGFTPFEGQSFMVSLNSWGEVKFVSGKIPLLGNYSDVFYLTSKDGDILYDFNSYKNAPFPYDEDVEAVSFEDVNKDGLKDIIIITVDDRKDSNTFGETTAGVYLQKSDGSFTADSNLNQDINDSGNNKDIKTVMNYLSQKF